MIKKFCDLCKEELTNNKTDVLGDPDTAIPIGQYKVNLEVNSHVNVKHPALCSQCFLEKYIKYYKNQLKSPKKDIPGIIDKALIKD